MERIGGTRWAAYAIATAAALMTATLLGAIASRSTARWAIGPLTRLRDRLGETTGDPDLGADEGVREVDALRAALRASLRRSAVAAATAQRFAADASHELRTPLSTISAELELYAEQLTTADTRDAITRIRRSVANLSRLTERLLVLARAGEMVEGGDAVMLGEICESMRSADVLVRGDGVVRGDETLLTRMIENAVQNALLHGSPPVEITVTERDDDVVVDVVDHGHGVAGADRERLFEPFVRARGSEREGFGLGLSLIAQVARAHRGTAAFVSAERGARLQIILPRWRPR